VIVGLHGTVDEGDPHVRTYWRYCQRQVPRSPALLRRWPGGPQSVIRSHLGHRVLLLIGLRSRPAGTVRPKGLGGEEWLVLLADPRQSLAGDRHQHGCPHVYTCLPTTDTYAKERGRGR